MNNRLTNWHQLQAQRRHNIYVYQDSRFSPSLLIAREDATLPISLLQESFPFEEYKFDLITSGVSTPIAEAYLLMFSRAYSTY